MRKRILETIIATLQPKDFILALWQGGSAAHGYTDEWSDIDIVAIVEDNYVEETFKLLEKSLLTISEIKFNFRVPEPTWHGHSQCFYQLEAASSFLLIDFAVMKRSSPNHFLEMERHGKIVVAFDKANLLVVPLLNLSEHFSKMKARFDHLQKNFDFLQIFVKKEINRGRLVEAIANYHSYTLPPLVELLGMVYRPYRYDFQTKYFSRDFPAEVIARMEPLYCVRDIADLRKKQQLAELFFAETLPRAEEVITRANLTHL